MDASTKEVTLLLVEDDDVDAMNIERGFRKKRIANPIVRAHDGVEGLHLLKNNTVIPPYIILLDLQMPRMNGLEFLDYIRDDPELHESVVFVLTTSRAEEDINASYSKHIAGYFVKDETHESFMKVIDVLQGYWKIVHLPEN
ncbi:response regulator [Emcibacter sp.]|uniref:response regulator n=1 Tax=Emcibacter sp. TaxID=1979954 RepID=UPI002AA92391|nr:response regulator [Emcibacter sp.]